MCFCVFFSFFLWLENTITHTICCVFVFFCLKSSWHFLPCVFCVFVFFFFKFLSRYFCTFLFCHVLVLPDQKFCRFFLAFFRFISCLLSANIFFWLILICFLVYSWIILFFWILSSLPQNFAFSYLVFVFLYDALCVVFRWRSCCFLSQHVVSSFPSESNQTKLWNSASKSANYFQTKDCPFLAAGTVLWNCCSPFFVLPAVINFFSTYFLPFFLQDFAVIMDRKLTPLMVNGVMP